MRDQSRIYDYISTLAEIWYKYPDLRFSQLVLNVIGLNDYYIEDDEIFEQFKKLYKVGDYNE